MPKVSSDGCRDLRPLGPCALITKLTIVHGSSVRSHARTCLGNTANCSLELLLLLTVLLLQQFRTYRVPPRLWYVLQTS